MQIAVLMGSPRKKDTYRICQMINEIISENTECTFEYIHLSDYDIMECKGCDQCFLRGEERCPNKDDVNLIKEKLLYADGIIFAAPVYAYHIPGQLKILCDRLAYVFHRQILVGKPAIIISTTAGGGLKPVMSFLKMMAVGWGCFCVGEIGIIAPKFYKKNNYGSNAYNEAYFRKNEKAIGKLATRLRTQIQSNKKPIPNFYEIYMFQGLRSKIYSSQYDYDFWAQKGWIDGCYFYETKIGPVKKLFGYFLRMSIDLMFKSKVKKISNATKTNAKY